MDADLGPLEGTEFDSMPISTRTRSGRREGGRGQNDTAPKEQSNARTTSGDKSGPLPPEGSDPAVRAGEGGSQLPPDEFARLARDRLNREVRDRDEAGRGGEEGAGDRPDIEVVEVGGLYEKGGRGGGAETFNCPYRSFQREGK